MAGLVVGGDSFGLWWWWLVVVVRLVVVVVARLVGWSFRYP